MKESRNGWIAGLVFILILIAGCLGVGWVCYEIYNRLGKNEKASGGGPA